MEILGEKELQRVEPWNLASGSAMSVYSCAPMISIKEAQEIFLKEKLPEKTWFFINPRSKRIVACTNPTDLDVLPAFNTSIFILCRPTNYNFSYLPSSSASLLLEAATFFDKPQAVLVSLPSTCMCSSLSHLSQDVPSLIMMIFIIRTFFSIWWIWSLKCQHYRCSFSFELRVLLNWW